MTSVDDGMGTGDAHDVGAPDTGSVGDVDAREDPRAHSHAEVAPTRVSSVWTAAVGAVLLLLLLAVFVGQNSHSAEVAFLGWHGRAPMAVLLLVAVVVGGALVAAAGAARILQLRRHRTAGEPRTR